jgi:hypothetical protein
MYRDNEKTPKIWMKVIQTIDKLTILKDKKLISLIV